MLTIRVVISLEKKLSDQIDVLLAALKPIDTSKLAAADTALQNGTGVLDASLSANQ